MTLTGRRGLVALTLGGLAVLAADSAVATPQCYAVRFQVNTAGQVFDAATGLTWQQTPIASAGDVMSWNVATTKCTALGSGWRLPSVKELQTIVDDTTSAPAINLAAFPGVGSSDSYWTSSPDPATPGNYYTVWFSDGTTGSRDGFIRQDIWVRCVR